MNLAQHSVWNIRNAGAIAQVNRPLPDLFCPQDRRLTRRDRRAIWQAQRSAPALIGEVAPFDVEMHLRMAKEAAQGVRWQCGAKADLGISVLGNRLRYSGACSLEQMCEEPGVVTDMGNELSAGLAVAECGVQKFRIAQLV